VAEIKRHRGEVIRRNDAPVGTISANNDKQVAASLPEAMKKVGKDGVITVEESKDHGTTLEVAKGCSLMRIPVTDTLSPTRPGGVRAWGRAV